MQSAFYNYLDKENTGSNHKSYLLEGDFSLREHNQNIPAYSQNYNVMDHQYNPLSANTKPKYNNIERSVSPSYARPRRPRDEEYFQEKFSFTPEVHDLPVEIYGPEHQKKIVNHQDHINKLAQPKKDEIINREREKIMKESEEIQRECTFKPTINKNSQNISSKHSTNLDQTVTDRLYTEGVEKLKYKEIEKRRHDDDNAQYPFHPDVKDSVQYLKGEKAAQKPLHERIAEIQKQKQEYLLKLKLNAEAQNQDLTFKPKLNELTEQIANDKKIQNSVTDRLMKDAHDKVYKRMKAAKDYQEQVSSICTFKPEINPISKSNDEILENNDAYTLNKDFITRQNILADASREKFERRMTRILEEEDCTFQPRISKISEFLMEADGERIQETIHQKADRLSKKDQQKKEIYQEQLQKAYYDQYKFTPEINPVSKGLGRKNSLETLAFNKEGKEHLLKLRDEALEKKMEGCTFKPEIKPKKKFSKVQSSYKTDQNILDNIKMAQKKKELEAEQQRKLGEYNQFKECTFKPGVNAEMPEDFTQEKLPSAVAGIEKFLQNRDRAKKLQKEKKEREDKVFRIEKKYSEAKHETTTTPKPFKLSYGQKRGLRDERFQKEIKDKEAETCTFKPITNEGKNREIIRKIIEDD